MKKVLILVMSSEQSYYQDLMEASAQTWNQEKIEGVETLFYCGDMESHGHNKDTVYLNVKETLGNVSRKTYMAFEYAVEMSLPKYQLVDRFDYILRANASTYIDKQVLLDYVQDKPKTYFAGLVAPTENGGKFMWGVQYIISRDLVELSVKKQWDYSKMDDRALSLVLENECEFQNGRMITLHHKENSYEYLTYEEGVGGGGFVKDLSELPKGHYAYRVKQDFDRSLDCKIMKELYEAKKSKITT